eukprot:Blabericola_migrator_1__10908@NODE_62_length_15736_cov_138_574510_g56_i0_p7_GENE_NODE_62_length_15736_cov_138_574510_g56_i0NODE_62_length_15736_cov_138_574510_g56_i0_p7_ORF_typecomplete_len269_score22_74_NODE_62_length_15736_cov_138_574510_g56_i026813487
MIDLLTNDRGWEAYSHRSVDLPSPRPSPSLDLVLPFLQQLTVKELFKFRRLNSTLNKFILTLFYPPAIDLTGISKPMSPLLSTWLKRVAREATSVVCHSPLPMTLREFEAVLLLSHKRLVNLDINSSVSDHFQSEAIEDGVDVCSRILRGRHRHPSPLHYNLDEWPFFNKLKFVKWVPLGPSQVPHTLRPVLPPPRMCPNLQFISLSIGGWLYLRRLGWVFSHEVNTSEAVIRDWAWTEQSGLAVLVSQLAPRFHWTTIRYTRHHGIQ